MHPARVILQSLPRLLRSARSEERTSPTRNPKAPDLSRIQIRALKKTYQAALLSRLDCDPQGRSRRTGKPAWESLPWSAGLIAEIGGDSWQVLALACWLDRHATTTRATYGRLIASAWRHLDVRTIEEAIALPTEAGLTWMRHLRRSTTSRGTPRQPRTINTAVAALNSWAHFAHGLGLHRIPWTVLPAVPVSSGRHIDREPIVLTAEQLGQFWTAAATLPRRRFLALVLDSLHGLRRSEVARLTWGDFRVRRRGTNAAPAVFRIVGKGGRHRQVAVHPSVRPWLETQRKGQPSARPILADAQGNAPSPDQISAWAKAVFRLIGMPEGYAHALRATWATLALEAKHAPLQVQQSGGWRRTETMLTHYYKRRAIPLIDPIPARMG